MARFLKVIVNLILICAILVAGVLLIPPLAGVNMVIVDSAEMDTNLPLGSATYAFTKPVTELNAGDKILQEATGKSYVYSIDAMDQATGTFTLSDHDVAEAESQDVVLRNTVPKVFITIPYIGYVVMALKSTEGLIIIALAVVFVIILFILAELWKKSDDDDDDEVPAEFWDRDSTMSAKDLKKSMKKKAKAEKKSGRRGFVDEDDEPLVDRVPTRARKETLEEIKDGAVDRMMQADTLTADIMEKATGELAQSIGEVKAEEYARVSEDDYEIEEEETVQLSPEEVAMPNLSAEELLQKAKQEGDAPKVVEDEDAGVTLLDYSDII